MMRLAESKRLISRNPFLEVDFLKEKNSRTPHIVTFEEEEQILAAAPPFLRVLIVLILETGMRSHREALALKWEAINFQGDSIRVRESKTRAGIRNIPLTARCKSELVDWREKLGPHFSQFVFPNMWAPTKPRNDIRHAWAKTLESARIPYFWLYNLRHSYASRLSAAGVSDLFVAQMIGHNSPGILQKYSKAIDEYRREAVRKLERMRAEHATKRQEDSKPPADSSKSSPPEPAAPIRKNYYSFTTVRSFPQGKKPLQRCSAHCRSLKTKKILWCREGESNPQGTRYRRILSPLRLPVPPSRLYLQVPDFTTSLWPSFLFIQNDECATV